MGMDDLIRDQEEREMRERGESLGKRTLIGRVINFYGKISVAAIDLTGSLKIGDTIEIENEEGAIRQKVLSMQINKKDVEEASEGDSVGVRVDQRIIRGSKVYRVE